MSQDRHLVAFLRYLAVERGLAANTQQAYGQDLKRFALSLKTSRVPLNRARRQDLLAHLRSPNRWPAPSTR